MITSIVSTNEYEPKSFLELSQGINKAFQFIDTITLFTIIHGPINNIGHYLKYHFTEKENGFTFQSYKNIFYSKTKAPIAIIYYPFMWDKQSRLAV